MIELNILKKIDYRKSGGMPNERKKKYFDKTYLTLFRFHIAIPIKNNLKGGKMKGKEIWEGIISVFGVIANLGAIVFICFGLVVIADSIVKRYPDLNILVRLMIVCGGLIVLGKSITINWVNWFDNPKD